jgi:hypothetical protein
MATHFDLDQIDAIVNGQPTGLRAQYEIEQLNSLLSSRLSHIYVWFAPDGNPQHEQEVQLRFRTSPNEAPPAARTRTARVINRVGAAALRAATTSAASRRRISPHFMMRMNHRLQGHHGLQGRLEIIPLHDGDGFSSNLAASFTFPCRRRDVTVLQFINVLRGRPAQLQLAIAGNAGRTSGGSLIDSFNLRYVQEVNGSPVHVMVGYRDFV